MRQTVLVLASLVCLSACVGAPQYVVDQGRRQDLASASGPEAAARCAARNATRFGGPYTAVWSEFVRPGTYQTVVMRADNRQLFPRDPIIVVRTAPAEKGSQLALYFASRLDPAAEADWVERLRSPC